MNAIKHISFVAAILALASSFAYAASPSKVADEAAIREQTRGWIKAYNSGDAKTAAAQYAADALLMPPNAPTAKGNPAILAFLARDMADSHAAGVVFHTDPNTDVGISEVLGWESGSYTITLKDAVVETGKFLSVSRKMNGKWLHMRDTYNADMPPSPASGH